MDAAVMRNSAIRRTAVHSVVPRLPWRVLKGLCQLIASDGGDTVYVGNKACAFNKVQRQYRLVEHLDQVRVPYLAPGCWSCVTHTT